jgi:NAD(P)-dependent dehydrogenase (short-subunit alcohol dehydrogenase family)
MDDNNALEGRVAIVTGGARGVGRAIAEGLVGAAAKVVIVDNGASISGEPEEAGIAETVASEISAGTIGIDEDISKHEAARDAVATAVEKFGAVDIVINNAAILRDAFVFKGTAEDWDQVIATNLSGAFYLLNAATPVMREQAKAGRGDGKWGRVVNIVSTVGFYGNFGQSPYASAKGGLLGLTRVVALDLARANITCNALAPFAATRVTDTIQPANEAQQTYKDRALNVPARHVANVVNYLCSEKAQNVTGQLLGVRGREVILFSQPRPVAEIANHENDWTIDSLSEAVNSNFSDKFASMENGIEPFGTEPIV